MDKKSQGSFTLLRQEEYSKLIPVHKHLFANVTYKSKTLCCVCDKFIWGYYPHENYVKLTKCGVAFEWYFEKNGCKCTQCFADCHEACLKKLPASYSCDPVPHSVGRNKVKMSVADFLEMEDDLLLAKPTPGFNIEDGESENLEMFGANPFWNLEEGSMIETPFQEMAWYKLYFVGNHHEFFIPGDKNSEFIISILREEQQTAFLSTTYTQQYRIIVWSVEGESQWTIPVEPNETLTVNNILEIVGIKKCFMRRLKNDSSVFANLSKELLTMESELFPSKYKVGVVYCKKGQTTQQEMFANQHDSKDFTEFLELIGSKIDINTWTGYLGGLRAGFTGDHSYFTTVEGNEMMYHVSTLLPYSEKDDQQVKRKRHIGNDIVVIVFQDEPGLFYSPLTIPSKFIHVYILVTKTGTGPHGPTYALNVVSHNSVPPFGPFLPSPPLFSDKERFRKFLLAKIINAEKSVYQTMQFQARRHRTLKTFIHYLQEKFTKETSSRVGLRSHLTKESSKKSAEEFGLERRSSTTSIASSISISRSSIEEQKGGEDDDVTPWKKYENAISADDASLDKLDLPSIQIKTINFLREDGTPSTPVTPSSLAHSVSSMSLSSANSQEDGEMNWEHFQPGELEYSDNTDIPTELLGSLRFKEKSRSPVFEKLQ